MEKYFIYIFAGFLGGIVRGLVGFVKKKTQISFLAGYTGTDFIENLYKIKLDQKFDIIELGRAKLFFKSNEGR